MAAKKTSKKITKKPAAAKKRKPMSKLDQVTVGEIVAADAGVTSSGRQRPAGGDDVLDRIVRAHDAAPAKNSCHVGSFSGISDGPMVPK